MLLSPRASVIATTCVCVWHATNLSDQNHTHFSLYLNPYMSRINLKPSKAMMDVLWVSSPQEITLSQGIPLPLLSLSFFVILWPTRPPLSMGMSTVFSPDLTDTEGITEAESGLTQLDPPVRKLGWTQNTKVLSCTFLSLKYASIILSIFNDLNALKRLHSLSPEA